MSKYFYSVVALTLLFSVLSFVSYRKNDGAVRFAFGVIMIAALLLPLWDILPTLDIGAIIEEIKDSVPDTPLYEEKTEKAIAEGVEKAVCEKFSFSEDCVSAIVFGFDFGEMKAEKIKLTLRGGAVFADAKAVKKFVSELGLGVCEVSFEI